MIRLSLVFISILSVLPAPAASQERTNRKGPVVRQADRILIESNDPKSLFRFFSETLRLPVAWPIAEHETYTSGSISTGNVTLEIYRYGAGKDTAGKARYTGLSLEPYPLDDALQELRIIGIPYNPPQIHTSFLPNRSEGTAWTTVELPSLSHPALPVSLFEYSPLFLNVAVRRMQFGNRLALNEGGPLGIASMHLIVLESANAVEDEAEWIRLLGKPKPDGDLHAVLGPAFRIVQGSTNGVQKIVLKVKSLERAEAFLREQKLLGKKNKEEIFIDSTGIQGLRISLIEGTSGT
jgi:hypothetical protein